MQFNAGRGILERANSGKIDYSKFDLERMFVAQANTAEQKIYAFNALSNTDEDQSALVIFNYNQPGAHAVLVETRPKSITYLDYVENTKTIVTPSRDGIRCMTYKLDETSSLFDGAGTAHCIQDAYSNHGWISVWAFVQTAFIPATGAAIAAACAIHNI